MSLRLILGQWHEPDVQARFLRDCDHDVVRAVLKALIVTRDGRALLNTAANYIWHWQRADIAHFGYAAAPDLGGTLATAWTGPKISFMHTEKCGGISAVKWLAPRFHPDQINQDIFRDLPPHLLMRGLQKLGDDTARFPFIWGHYDLATLRRIDAGRFIFTFLREPRARIVSLYHYWRSVDEAFFDPEMSFAVSLAHQLSLQEFLDYPDPLMRDSIDNVFVRRLTGLYATGAARDPLAVDPLGSLAKAQAALADLDFVGITERLDESLARLAAFLGIPPPEAQARANITDENHLDPSGWFRIAKRGEITDGAKAALNRRTALDQQLYARALAKFEAA